MTQKQIEYDRQVTREGNPGKPQGEAGYEMLERMGRSHFEVTGWGLGFADIQPDDSVLDIGCGGGAALKRMAECVREGHLTGVDHSAVSVQAASDLNREEIEAGKTDILEASVEQMPFPDQSFDKIITIESFYFWPSPEENLREVFRVLIGGGRFLVLCDIYKKADLSDEAFANIEQYQLSVFTPEEYQVMFEKAGFSDVKVHLKKETDWICVEGRR